FWFMGFTLFGAWGRRRPELSPRSRGENETPPVRRDHRPRANARHASRPANRIICHTDPVQEDFIMLTSFFRRWFSRLAACVAPGHRPQVVAPLVPAPRGPRLSATVSPVQVAVSRTSDDMVIWVKGEATAQSVGALLAGLLAPSACRPALVTLD